MEIKKNSLYFIHLPGSFEWTDLHEILHRGSTVRHNYMFQILCRSVEGLRICVGRILPFSIDLDGRH